MISPNWHEFLESFILYVVMSYLTYNVGLPEGYPSLQYMVGVEKMIAFTLILRVERIVNLALSKYTITIWFS